MADTSSPLEKGRDCEGAPAVCSCSRSEQASWLAGVLMTPANKWRFRSDLHSALRTDLAPSESKPRRGWIREGGGDRRTNVPVLPAALIHPEAKVPLARGPGPGVGRRYLASIGPPCRREQTAERRTPKTPTVDSAVSLVVFVVIKGKRLQFSPVTMQTQVQCTWLGRWRSWRMCSVCVWVCVSWGGCHYQQTD